MRGYLALSNFGGLEVKVNNTGEALRYWLYGKPGPRPVRINYLQNGDASAKILGKTYRLSQFIKIIDMSTLQWYKEKLARWAYEEIGTAVEYQYYRRPSDLGNITEIWEWVQDSHDVRQIALNEKERARVISAIIELAKVTLWPVCH